MDEGECLFCRIISGELQSAKVYEDDFVYAFKDIDPQAPDHVLITPKKHIDGVGSMEEADIEIVGRIMFAAKIVASIVSAPQNSYRVVFNQGPLALQSVPHLHAHFLAGREMEWPPG